MEKVEDIYGVRVTFSLDTVFFADDIITSEKDKMKVKENVGKLSKDIKNILSEALLRTELDDLDVDIMSVEYIDEDTIDDYIRVV